MTLSSGSDQDTFTAVLESILEHCREGYTRMKQVTLLMGPCLVPFETMNAFDVFDICHALSWKE